MLLDAPYATPPAIIDVRPLGQRGAPGTPGGIIWPSRAAAAADAIPVNLPAIRLLGYQFPGDGGEATYVRIAAPNTPAAYQFRSQDGAWWELAEHRPNVAQFGALGTGAAETAALQAAIDYGRDRKRQVYFGSETYVAATLTVYEHTCLKGEGRTKTVIKLAAGTNADLIQSEGFASLANSNTDGGTHDVRIKDLTLDGNRAANSAGNCLSLYGAGLTLEDLWVINAPVDGMHTEYSSGGIGEHGMEARVRSITVDRCGRHCWNFRGGHDAQVFDVILMSASLNGEGAGNNLHIDGMANGRFTQVHSWQRADAPRSLYAAYVGGFGANTFDGCHFEGSLIPVGIFSVKNAFSPSCMYYASAGGCTILMGGTATVNSIYGQIQDKHFPSSSAFPDVVGIRFRSNPGDYIADNTIDLLSFVQNAGQVDYGTKSGGNNSIRLRGYAASGYDWIGSPHPRDTAVRDIRVSGPVQSVANTSRAPRNAAAVSFDATTGAIFSRSNVTSVTKIAPGQWRLNFAERVPAGAKVVGNCANGPDHINVVVAPYGNDEISQDILIRRTDTEAASDSPAYVSVLVVAPSE